MLSSLIRLVSNGPAAGHGRTSPRAHLPSAPGRSQPLPDSPEELYRTFIADWEHIESTLTVPHEAALHHGISRTELPERLERLGQAIVHESMISDEVMDGMAPCMEYLLKKDVLSALVRSATADRPSGTLIEVVKFFQTLVANLDGLFLSQQGVNKPLVRLIRHCVGDEDVDSSWGRDAGFNVAEEREQFRREHSEQLQLDEALVGLMAFVAAKLHSSQELLYIFFHDRLKDTGRYAGSSHQGYSGLAVQNPEAHRRSSSRSSVSSTATVKAGRITEPTEARQSEEEKSYDFPLFTYLLRFVHLDGQTGQLARAGLSVIVQIAFQARPLEAPPSPEPSSRKVRFTQDVGRAVSSDLAQYILGSDFSDVLGASLGAVWGLLPSKLAFVTDQSIFLGESSAEGGLRLGAGKLDHNVEIELERMRRMNIDNGTDPQTVEKLKLLIDILDFVQNDVLPRAVQGASADLDRRLLASQELLLRLSASIRQSLLENVVSLSMIECGDRDGSAVAIMSYLEVLLSTIDDRHTLSESIVGWLVRQDNHQLGRSAKSSGVGAASRKRSAALTLLQEEKRSRKEEASFDPLLQYTLKDLVVDHIAPTISDASVTAALGLARSLFAFHGRFAPYGFINVLGDDQAVAFPFYLPQISGGSERTDEESFTHSPLYSSPPLDCFAADVICGLSNVRVVTLSQHLKELDLYSSLFAALHSATGLTATSSATHAYLSSSTGYVNYLKDAEAALLGDSMYLYGLEHGLTCASSSLANFQVGDLALTTSQNTRNLHYTAFRHRLDPRDLLLRSILARLRRFFEQPPELNVALTSTIAAIALCPYRSLGGWLTFEPPSRCDDGMGENIKDYNWRTGPHFFAPGSLGQDESPKHTPVVLELLKRLADHVQNYRTSIPDFDTFLTERRRGLLFVENISDALASMDSSEGEQEAAATWASLPTSSKSEKSRTKLWRSVGWDSSEFSSIGDIHMLDAREINLPPRPADVESPPGNKGRFSPGGPTSTFTRLFGRSPSGKNRSRGTSRPSEVDQETREAQALPFAEHYRQTSSITLQPTFVPMPEGPWSLPRSRSPVASKVVKEDTAATEHSTMKGEVSSPAVADYSDSGISLLKPEKRTRFQLPGDGSPKSKTRSHTKEGEPGGRRTSNDPVVDDQQQEVSEDDLKEGVLHLAYPGLDEDEKEEARRSRGRVTLSDLLDNVVILEEFIKELTAIIQVRRSLGIDLVDLLR